MVRPPDWFDPVLRRIDVDTGLEITDAEWEGWDWHDVTTMQGYMPGTHLYMRGMQALRPNAEFKQVKDWIKDGR